MSRPTRVKPHQFAEDLTTPRDYHGRAWCRWCRLPGEPGDERHPEDAAPIYPPTPPEVRSDELRRLGERDDEGDLT